MRGHLHTPQRITLTAIAAVLAMGRVGAPPSMATPIAIQPSPPGARPHVLPLRVPDPSAYAAAKSASKRAYRAQLARHPQQPPGIAHGISPSFSGSLAPTPLTASTPESTTASTPESLTAVFDGLSEAGIAGGGLYTNDTPPDTTGAIGPNHYVELVNSEIAVYSRTLLSSPVARAGEKEFTGQSNACGDGQIRWDQQGKRWEYALLECTESHTEEGLAFGWSKTEDPSNLTTGWCRYHKQTGAVLEDFPKLGGDDEFLLIGVNGFEENPKGEEEFVGSSVFAIPKPAPGESSCPLESLLLPTIHELKLPPEVFTPVPANVYGSSTTGYVVASEYPNSKAEGKALTLFDVTRSLVGEPTLSAPATVGVKAYFFPPNVPQPQPSTDELDSSDTRLTQAVAAEDPALHRLAIWTQHTVSLVKGQPAVVRWYELNGSTSSLVQEGAVEASEGNFAFNGAISPTAEGGAVIDYNVGGPQTLVQLHAQSRLPTTPAGKTANDVKLAESQAVDADFSCPSAKTQYSGEACRWGDYAGASPDPSNPDVVWGSGQFDGVFNANNAQWRTDNFAVTTADAPPTAAFGWTPTSPSAGSTVVFDASRSEDPDGQVSAYEWSFGDGSANVKTTATTTSHAYASTGVYTVTLIVTDNAGLTGSAAQTMTVSASGGTVTEPTTTNTQPSTTTEPATTSSGTTSQPPGTSPQPNGATLQTGGATILSSPPATATITTAAPPSGVRVIRVRPRKDGSVLVTISVPAQGRLLARQQPGRAGRHGRKRARLFIESARRTVAHAGTLTLRIVPTPMARIALRRIHRLSVVLQITFQPLHGSRSVTSAKLVLHPPARQRRRGLRP